MGLTDTVIFLRQHAKSHLSSLSRGGKVRRFRKHLRYTTMKRLEAAKMLDEVWVKSHAKLDTTRGMNRDEAGQVRVWAFEILGMVWHYVF